MFSTTKQPKFQNMNQITKYRGYDPKKSMEFGKVKEGTVGTATFCRIPIQTRYPNGTLGDLLIAGPTLFSFGLQINTNIQSGQPDGWTFPLCLHSRDGATAEETEFENKLKEIVEHCRTYLLKPEVSESVGKYDLERSQLKDADFSFLKLKKDEKKRIIADSPPVIYTKVIDQKCDNGDRKIMSIFYDSSGQYLDPFSLLNVRGKTVPVLKIESIFVGAKIVNVQVKLWETKFMPISSAPVALLRPEEEEDVDVDMGCNTDGMSSSVVMEKKVEDDFSNSVEEKEIKNSDDEQEVKEEEVKKPVKKTVQNKKK